MVSKTKVAKKIDDGLFDDRWTGETASYIIDGVIYDLNLHSKHGVKRRVLPNDKTLASSICLRERLESFSGDVGGDVIREAKRDCLSDPFQSISRKGMDYMKVAYVDRLVEENSDKPTDVKNTIKMQILQANYGIDWNFGGQ